MESEFFVGWTAGLSRGRPVYGYQVVVMAGIKWGGVWRGFRLPLGPVVTPRDYRRFEELPKWPIRAR